MFACAKCLSTFTRKDALRRHQRQSCPDKRSGPINDLKTSTEGPSPSKKSKQSGTLSSVASTSSAGYCHHCDVYIPQHAYTGHLRSKKHKDVVSACTSTNNCVQVVQTAFKTRIATYRVTSVDHHYISVKEFMNSIKDIVFELIEEQRKLFRSIKVNVELFGFYVLPTKDTQDLKSFNTRNKIISEGADLTEIYNDFTTILDEKAAEFQERDSGWALQQLLYLEVNINQFNPLRSSSYLLLPKQIEAKKAVINVQNEDQCCFRWALLSALYPPLRDPQRTASYLHLTEKFNFNGIEFPVKLGAITKFEQQNPISINVYGLQEEFEEGVSKYQVVGPLYYSECKKPVHVNLLLISDLEGHKATVHFCDGCLQYFRSSEQLIRHSQFDCDHIYTRLPKTDFVKNKLGVETRGNILSFDNYQKQLQVPFVVYADFESILKPIQSAEPDPLKKFTIKTFEHEPYSFAYFIKCSYDDTLSNFKIYRGQEAALTFMTSLEQDIRNLYKNYLKHVIPMRPLTDLEIQNFENAPLCHICDKPFDSETNDRVQDHCHLSGLYRGAAHSRCNLNYKIPNFVPVFFHNLTCYDSHLFVKQLALKKEKVEVLALNKEKYISFSKYLLVDQIHDGSKLRKVFLRMRFLDSCRFLNSSLDQLSQNLSSSQCLEIKKMFGVGRGFELMRQKGVFPYSYVDSFEKLDEPSLPILPQFYDILKCENITESEYERAKEVWTLFNCKSLGDYSDLYLKTDVLLLADVFENFRSVCMQHYKLDPTQFFTSPGLSWNAMLKSTGVELELLTDIDMVHFFKNGIRGGVSICPSRKSIANNKFLSNFDPSKPTSFIVYLDATNLYGFGMRQYLPQRDFSWLSVDEIQNLNVSEISDESDIGYVLEVDLHYPENLHVLHNDFPFCPESMIPPTSKLKGKKLIPTLFDKQKYIIHYQNLKQCLAHGLKLENVHRVLKFKQSPWLRKYIDLNTNLRNLAKNESDRDFFKLMSNSVFGKMLENVYNRVDVKLVSHWERNGHKVGAEGYISKSNFKNVAIFSENLVAIEMSKVSVTYDKPIYVGFSILDISKTVMYDFYYNFLKPLYGDKVSLLYHDTDSLVIEVITDNFYKDMIDHLDKFDTSKFKADNIHGIPITNSVVGKMKDEYSGVPLYSFYGAGNKAYCVDVGNKIDKKAKGVKKGVIKNCLSQRDYINVVENNATVVKKMYVFRSHLHTMYTELKNKVALSSSDDKRYLIPGSTKTLAWGHEDIERTKKLDFLIHLLEDN